ncbi:MAG TPA: histidinol-phosphatase [Rhizomicrobium sp.]|nr:histidinol-phosphatase [Rhizomicrobium sp.]
MTIDAATIAFAHRLADTAGEVIRPYFRRRIDIDDKGGPKGEVFDPVTEADKGAERAIRAVIDRERPEDAILGEEYGEKAGTSGLRWVLDPVDGTRAFINGRHEWGSLIALEKDGKPTLGIIDQPVLGERFIGVNGKTKFMVRGIEEELRVRPCARVEDAILCCTHPYAYFGAEERAGFRRVSEKVKMSRFGGDCYIFGLLAMGFCDTIVESTFKRWDVAALIPVIEGAGGIITNWQGGDCSEGGQCVASGDARVHDAVLKLLAG